MLRGRWGLVWVGSAALLAQDADRAMISSRAAEIEAQRRQKADDLQPETLSKPERILQAVKQNRVVERVTSGAAGFRVHLGGLITGSGFAAGPEYYRRLSNERVIVRSSARASFRKFYVLDTELRLPRLAEDRAFVNLYAVHHNYPNIDYYGPGPDSAKTGRSGWALEDTWFEARAGVRPFRHFSVGALGRYLLVNVGPGRDERFVSADRIYSPAVTPGIQRQSDYLIAGGFAQYDYRDNPGGPRRGGYYSAQFANYSDREARIGSFYRLDLEAQQYIGFTNRRRVIALRGRTSFTDPRAGQFVPFYLQPTVGGSEDLRGFRTFRFYDNNSIVLNGEYRWEVFSGMDMALFADAGKVFHRYQDVSLENLERSYGFGLRFNVRNDVFLRIDTGFSREGFQVWFKFNNVF